MKMSVTMTAALTAAATALTVPAAVATRHGPEEKPAPAQTYQVTQKFVQFNPTELKINTGDTVVWTNKETDDTTHSVVQGNGDDIDSPDIQPGHQFTWKFDFPGEWDIICRFHPAMFETINVVGKAIPGAKMPGQQHHRTEAPPAAKPTVPGGSTIPGVTGLPIATHRHPRR
ncbi:MAG TPA: cupredoxin domain-containing protein [Sporichthyaceae bacterium]|jgi:plastocyanin|nr:cupredoxin domain-containing protein [Sporichthyaceae bacterium]